MSTATFTAPSVPAYQETAEWKEILERHRNCLKNGTVSIVELTPAHEKVFGGWAIAGQVKDKYGNVILHTNNREDRIGIEPLGAIFRYDNPEHLKFIYALLHGVNIRPYLQFPGENFLKMQHRFKVVDLEKESELYASKREEDIKYMNKIYSLSENVINLLCIVTATTTDATLGVKRANLCKVWEDGGKVDGDKAMHVKNKLKEMMDSPDIDYYEAAYYALSLGDAQLQKGFYKTQAGVYKNNEEILGNSVDSVVAYLKTHDDVYIALRKKDGNTSKPVQKPK